MENTDNEQPASRFTLPRAYLSASQISTYLRCPMQYEFRYIHNIVSAPSIAMMTGSGVHEGLEMYYRDRINGITPLTPTQATEVAISAFEEESHKVDLTVTASEKDVVTADIKNTVAPYIQHVAPHFEPVAVEFEIRFQTQCGVEILGYVDLERKPLPVELQQLSPEERARGEETGEFNRLCDHKITGKKWADGKLKDELQFHLYPMATGKLSVEIHNAVKSARNRAHTVTDADFLASTQDMTQNIRLLRHTFNPSAFRHVELMVERVAGCITTGAFPPCEMGTWACSEKFCGYWSRCRGRTS